MPHMTFSIHFDTLIKQNQNIYIYILVTYKIFVEMQILNYESGVSNISGPIYNGLNVKKINVVKKNYSNNHPSG